MLEKELLRRNLGNREHPVPVTLAAQVPVPDSETAQGKCLGSVGSYLLGMNTGKVGVAR